MEDEMTNWNEIETAYLTERLSYRELAQRYGVDISAVKRRGKKGNWVEKRQWHQQQLQGELLDADKAQRCDRLLKLQSVADKLLERVEELGSAEEISAANLKTLSETLKNIRDAQMLKGKLDVVEQQSRIDKLRRELGKTEQEGQTIRVVLEGAEGFCD